MPAFALTSKAGDGQHQFQGKNTPYVWICGIVASTGGLMFGYDIGISGGVTAMDDFLEKFFPTVYVKKHRAKENNYCKYDNQGLQLFTSSLYLAAMVFSLAASKVCTKYGRKRTMLAASIFFLIGVVLDATAMNLVMLIIGRIFLGAGVGFANQAAPLFLSEIAPAQSRGALNIVFQLMVTVGILCANFVNYVMSNKHPWGWRASLGIAGVPAVILCVGSLVITETPTSLIEREMFEEGKAMLKKIRGIEEVDAEYNEMVEASERARRVKNPFRSLTKRSNRPPLVIAIMLQVFQQFTGINAIMFYAPVLFQTIGYKNDASLLSAAITGSVNVVCTLVSNALVDRAGRKVLLLEACVLMLITQSAIGGLLSVHLKSTNSLEKGVSLWVVILVCIYVANFAWSWGPLGWLIPSEIFPLESRSPGFAFAVVSNMFFTFLIAQAFLSMMCHMRAGIFFFFAAWIVVMGSFVILLLPETKGIPIDEMAERAWKKHWYWKRYMGDVDSDDATPKKIEH
ncbi:hypothetical protein MRB53_012252 [Persea americana]|uniref:Uncharacterized protein n=1 Tax=Persea americana TaxID=3435 RepID=A0ACC2LX61_PERAE|nr:hypothetical protein MRB53_012252 [Persea americana]